MDMNSTRIDQLEKQIEELEKQVQGVKEIQVTQQRTIHGLEKVTRGHNLRIFGLDKGYLVSKHLIQEDSWDAVFRYLCITGLRIDEDLVTKIFEHIDVIHELQSGGFIVCFNRRTDRTYIQNKKRGLGMWSPCSSMGPKYKYVSLQVDLPTTDQAEKVLRNQRCQLYKEAGLKVKYVGWSKMAVGDNPAQLYTKFPINPDQFKKDYPDLAKKASMNNR